MLGNDKLALIAVGTTDTTSECPITDGSVDILDGACYTGTLATTYSFTLQMYAAKDAARANLITSAVFTCDIDDEITVGQLDLTVDEPTFSGAAATDDTKYDLTLSTISDGVVGTLPSFGSEVAVYAIFETSSHFTASLTECSVKGGSPSDYGFWVNSNEVHASTTTAFDSVSGEGSNYVAGSVMYFTAVEDFSISGCKITLS